MAEPDGASEACLPQPEKSKEKSSRKEQQAAAKQRSIIRTY